MKSFESSIGGKNFSVLTALLAVKQPLLVLCMKVPVNNRKQTTKGVLPSYASDEQEELLVVSDDFFFIFSFIYMHYNVADKCDRVVRLFNTWA